jgi:large subunit ribosomal protein L31e
MAAKKDSKSDIERDYVIPLRSSFRNTTRHKRTPKAIRTIREFLVKHMKSEDVKMGMHLNEKMWENGIKNPPHHIKVHVTKKGDEVRAELVGFEFKEAVKAEKKKEPETMKDKIAAKLGVEEDKKEEPKETKEDKKEAPAKEAAEQPGESVKKPAKTQTPKKAPVSK